MTAGHSLGEFSALVTAGALDFEDGLRLVSARAMAMQKACELKPSTMAAVLALPRRKSGRNLRRRARHRCMCQLQLPRPARYLR